MRAVHLASPPMRGRDIEQLQEILNARLRHYHSRRHLTVDGVFGTDSAHALNSVGYIEGMEAPYGRIGVLQRVFHPHLRSPAEIARAHMRERARRAATSHPHGSPAGLGAIPEIAARYVGVHEHPPGSNWGAPYPQRWLSEFGFGPASWCGAFAGAMVNLAGGHVGGRVCYCPYIESDARTHTDGFDMWASNHHSVGPGWLVLYNWHGGSEPEHVGIVKAVHPDFIETVEGNTGGSNPSDGGMVAIERRPYTFTVGYARPRL